MRLSINFSKKSVVLWALLLSMGAAYALVEVGGLYLFSKGFKITGNAVANMQSGVPAASATSTTGVFRMQPLVLDANDLIFEIMDGASNDVFRLDYEGDLTIAGTTFAMLGTTTNTWTSATTASAASSTNGAFTLAPTATLDANDAVLNILSVAAGTSIFRVDVEGDTFTGGDIRPISSASFNVGNQNNMWIAGYFESINDNSNNARYVPLQAGYGLYRSTVSDSAANVAHRFINTQSLTSAKVMGWYSDNNSTLVASMTGEGVLGSATPEALLSVYPNGLLTAATFGGFMPTHNITLTRLTMYVSVASTATAANTVWTASDGTNTCTFTFPCNTTGFGGTQDTGTKGITATNGAGTGCVYAAGALITLAVTTQGCATAATVLNAELVGKWQVP